MRELHLEERPHRLDQLIGQDDAVAQLKGLSKTGMPHCLLFTGPSGCGKTTLARIVRKRLKCGDADFVEKNCAQERGIDLVRTLTKLVGLSPIDGDSRVYLIDECHQLTGEAQAAFLKLLEEPPDHVYFMLATTNPEKLKDTIITRCTQIRVRGLSEAELCDLVNLVAKKHDCDLDDEVVDKIATVADGSARKALVLLQQIMNLDGGSEAQINVLQQACSEVKAFEICQALMQQKTPWTKMARILASVTEDPEGIRWMVLGYCTKAVIGGFSKTKPDDYRKPGKGYKRAAAIMDCFQDNYYSTKKAGLVLSCFNVMHPDSEDSED